MPKRDPATPSVAPDPVDERTIPAAPDPDSAPVTTTTDSAPATESAPTAEDHAVEAARVSQVGYNPRADDTVALIYQGPGLVTFLPQANVTVAQLWALGVTQERADRVTGPGKPYRRTVAYPTDLPRARTVSRR